MIAVILLVALSLLPVPSADQTGHISGIVTVEGTSAPIADARVTIILVVPSGPIRQPQRTVTGQDGRFQFDDVEPGGYRISVEKMGFAPARNLPGQELDQLVRVGAGQSVDGVDRRLEKGAVISGRIFDANGEPIPDLRMMAMRRLSSGRGGPVRLTPAPGQSLGSNDLGEFRISGLPPGEYVVAAMPSPMHSSGSQSTFPGPRTILAQTFYPGTADELVATLVKVTAGAEVANISFAVQSTAAFRISGTVVDENGNAIANANVMLDGDGTTFFFPGLNTRTGADGHFVIADVPPGSYHMHATPMMTGSVSTRSPAATAPPRAIVVRDSDITGLLVVTRRPTPQ
jgi:protocatechuate 3,4-dioxygenase beta subunit